MDVPQWTPLLSFPRKRGAMRCLDAQAGSKAPESGIFRSNTPCCEAFQVVVRNQLQLLAQADLILVIDRAQGAARAVSEPRRLPSIIPSRLQAIFTQQMTDILKGHAAGHVTMARGAPLPSIEGDSHQNLVAGYMEKGIGQNPIHPIQTGNRSGRVVASEIVVGHDSDKVCRLA